MEQQFSHITINGKPLCQTEGHTMGLMNELGIACEHRSKQDALRAALKLRSHDPVRFSDFDAVQVIEGGCPEIEAYIGDGLPDLDDIDARTFREIKKDLDTAIWELLMFIDEAELNDELRIVEMHLKDGALQLTSKMVELGVRPLRSEFVSHEEAQS